jgi:hypothetical protein
MPFHIQIPKWDYYTAPLFGKDKMTKAIDKAAILQPQLQKRAKLHKEYQTNWERDRKERKERALKKQEFKQEQKQQQKEADDAKMKDDEIMKEINAQATNKILKSRNIILNVLDNLNPADKQGSTLDSCLVNRDMGDNQITIDLNYKNNSGGIFVKKITFKNVSRDDVIIALKEGKLDLLKSKLINLIAEPELSKPNKDKSGAAKEVDRSHGVKNKINENKFFNENKFMNFATQWGVLGKIDETSDEA